MAAHANGEVAIVPGKDDRGQHIFSVIVKRSYRIVPGGAAERLASDRPLRMIDAYFDGGDPEWSTIEHEFDLAPFKPMVDVVVVGKAYAPNAEPIDRVTVGVRVGDRKKLVTVVGDRVCRFRPNAAPLFTAPEPFTAIELRYERAYGGRDEKSRPDLPFFYPRNFAGVGVALDNVEDAIEGLPLPNFEDPDDPLTPDRIVIGDPARWHGQPMPQGFGWFSRTSYPRSTYAGAYPAHTEVGTVTPEERMGFVPADHIALAKQFRLPSFDARFNNGASHGLRFDHVAADEAIGLRGLTRDGAVDFRLPGERPRVSLDTGDGAQTLDARLDTVVIRADDLEVDLMWRGAFVYEGYEWLPQMRRLQAGVQ